MPFKPAPYNSSFDDTPCHECPARICPAAVAASLRRRIEPPVSPAHTRPRDRAAAAVAGGAMDAAARGRGGGGAAAPESSVAVLRASRRGRDCPSGPGVGLWHAPAGRGGAVDLGWPGDHGTDAAHTAAARRPGAR